MKRVKLILLSRFFHFFRNSLKSRVAWLFATIHVAWFFLAVAKMRPPSPRFAEFLEGLSGSSATVFAGRPFHYHYESIFMKLLILGDLPAMFAAMPLGLLLAPFSKLFHWSLYFRSYVGASLLLVFGTAEWLFIGRIVELRIEARRSPHSEKKIESLRD